jgi:hypothetical protein
LVGIPERFRHDFLAATSFFEGLPLLLLFDKKTVLLTFLSSKNGFCA